MKVILMFLVLASTSAFGGQPETVTVTAQRIDMSVLALPKLQNNNDRGGPSIGIGIHEGGNKEPSWGNKTACQECQSDSALYTCTVSVLVNVKESYDKTFQKLKQENCCKNQGGRVLTTRPIGC